MRKYSDTILKVVLVVVMALVVIVTVYPLYFSVIASFSEPSEVVTGRVTFTARGFTTEAYQNALNQTEIWVGFRNSLIYTLLGTILSLCLTVPAAYVLSKKQLKGRSILSWYFVLIMYLSGGLVPTYLIMKNLGLLNKAYSLVIIGSFSVYNMVVCRVYFESSIPEELYESARIDGCSEFGQFFKIALPLSAPIMAVIGLFYASARWNDYFNAMIYLSNSDLFPLQLVLRNILIQSQMAAAAIDPTLDPEAVYALTRRAYLAETMKYSLILISSAPMLILYPFVQKYFVKGMMIGAVKG